MKNLTRNQKIGITAAGVLLVAAVVMVVILFTGRAGETYRSIKVVETNGKVTIGREGIGDLDAAVNMNLVSGDSVQTGEGAYVVLMLDTDKYVMLGESGSMQVIAEGDEKAGRTSIQLAQGSVLSEIQNPLGQGASYDVVTPNATMSVRGTVFEIDRSADGLVTLLVYDGAVALGLDGQESALYNAGECMQFEEGNPPRVIVDRAPISEEMINGQIRKRLQEINESGRTLETGSVRLAGSGEDSDPAGQGGASEPEGAAEPDKSADSKEQGEAVEPTATPEPTTEPSAEPEATPKPTATPKPAATSRPTASPRPSAASTPAPANTPVPTQQPVPEPVVTPVPTQQPTSAPTPSATSTPAPVNTPVPTQQPTPVPTWQPTPVPTWQPTPVPTWQPTPVPTWSPTPTPTPTTEPTAAPTLEPTPTPTAEPTATPTTEPTDPPVQTCEVTFVNPYVWTNGTPEKISDLYGKKGTDAYTRVDAGKKITEPDDSKFFANSDNSSLSLEVDGWYREDGTEWDFDEDAVTENIVLYPVWKETSGGKKYGTVVLKDLWGSETWYVSLPYGTADMPKADKYGGDAGKYGWEKVYEGKMWDSGDSVSGVILLKMKEVSPEPSESPEPSASPEPTASPEPSESPEPSISPSPTPTS